jgi:hypothetical protein
MPPRKDVAPKGVKSKTKAAEKEKTKKEKIDKVSAKGKQTQFASSTRHSLGL